MRNSLPDREIGRKTFFWYRVYCAVLAAVYLLVAILGMFIGTARPQISGYSQQELVIIGFTYAIGGGVLLLVFAVGLLLPPKPYNWIVGIVLIALGLTSCCVMPASIALLIYWLKPETMAFFGR